jgi:hypothetical protein
MTGSDFMTLAAAGTEYEALGPRLLRRWVQERRIPFSKVGNRIILRRDDIEAVIAAGRVEAVGRRSPLTSVRRPA